MKLSIITVCFNNLDGLKKTADSVVTQSFRDFEWIIVDGGSSDGSKEYIESISEHISWWCSERDNGIYNGMNKGIRHAKGEYCLFLNSGDYLTDSDSLKRAMDCNFSEDVVWGYLLMEIDGKLVKLHSHDRVTLRTFIDDTIHHTGNAIIRRELFDEKNIGPYDENLKITSDWKWFLQAIGLGKASGRYLDVNLAVFDLTGISETRRDLALSERKQVIEELIPPRVIADYDDMTSELNELRGLKTSLNSYKWLSNISTGRLIKAILYKCIKPFK